MKHYEAPWSTSLIVMSIVTTVIYLGVAGGGWWSLAAKHAPGVFGWVVLLPVRLEVLSRLPKVIVNPRGAGGSGLCGHNCDRARKKRENQRQPTRSDSRGGFKVNRRFVSLAGLGLFHVDCAAVRKIPQNPLLRRAQTNTAGCGRKPASAPRRMG